MKLKAVVAWLWQRHLPGNDKRIEGHTNPTKENVDLVKDKEYIVRSYDDLLPQSEDYLHGRCCRGHRCRCSDIVNKYCWQAIVLVAFRDIIHVNQ